MLLSKVARVPARSRFALGHSCAAEVSSGAGPLTSPAEGSQASSGMITSAALKQAVAATVTDASRSAVSRRAMGDTLRARQTGNTR